MKLHASRSLALSLALVLCGASAAASNQYVLDDGVPNSGLSFGLPADFCWLEWFQTVGTSDTITSVQVMTYGTGLAVGHSITVCVWEDPTDDGDPSDAILVGSRTGTVQASAPNSFVDYALNAPGQVHGKFFVGAFCSVLNSESVGLLDYNSGLSGRAYFCYDYAVGQFDPTQLGNYGPSHIETLGAGIHGVYMLRATGSGDTTYCTGKTNSIGCVPQISSLGTPSATAGSGFFVFGTNELNRKTGLLLYTTAGRASTPFFGGTLCLASPLRRTPQQNSGGSLSGNDCSGVYGFDFNAWIAGGSDPALHAGVTVEAQYYSRDPGFAAPNNIGLTNGLEFTLQP